MKLPFLLTFLLFSGGCAVSSHSRSDKHQMEMSLHKIRTEVDEIKHDLNTYEIEHHVIEGKLIDQEQTIVDLKKQLLELNQSKLEMLNSDVLNVDKKVMLIEKKQEKILGDIRQLSAHANETTTALSQYKEKITHFEKAITVQEAQIRNIIKLKEGLAQLGASPPNIRYYVVQTGDNLEKIAREQNTTVEAIKRVNALESDLIVIGQRLQLP